MVIPYDLADTWCVWRAVTLGVWFKCHRFHHILKVRDLKFNYGGRKKRIKGKSAIFLRLTKGAGPFFKAKTAFVILKKKRKKKYINSLVSPYICVSSVYIQNKVVQYHPLIISTKFQHLPLPTPSFWNFFQSKNATKNFRKFWESKSWWGSKWHF